ncbi:hypothetical protein FXF51_56745 [Nonomuraea sp. PA05]|uniref:hypothetical protein n=1 Tax=Nonomuraea sp. PA05 TaxID=2604466 RepID=UPI0011D3C4D1|nr:hypothetical protein [Nonomuraea sp. PA05]TYB50231.1 hypothetical protein FXF51_56745 [Nonomuraea sp. PA05]
MRRGRAQARLELEAALEGEADRLQAAKQAHADHPSEETRAARRAEMESLAETRSWLRALHAIGKAEREITRLASRGATADEIRPYEQQITHIRAVHGPLIDAMAQLASAPAAEAGGELPPGAAEAAPPVVRGRARFGKGGDV